MLGLSYFVESLKPFSQAVHLVLFLPPSYQNNFWRRSMCVDVWVDMGQGGDFLKLVPLILSGKLDVLDHG